MAAWNRRKPIDQAPDSRPRLKATLSWPHLIALGVGGIVGTGIYTLTGVGADRAGPAVILAFLIAGTVCACAALGYAELACLMPVAGSAYSYSYAVLGELIAWVIGWSLILEYSVTCSAVAVGWSGYAEGALAAWGVHLPLAILVGPSGGGLVNLPAILIVVAVVALLLVGTKESATVTAVLVAIKLSALAAFVVLALSGFDGSRLSPFMPYGFSSHVEDGEVRGVMAAAALVFFAFFGFDAVSTAAEETKRPSRDLTIGIVGSMVLCTLIYMLVAAGATGALDFREFARSREPLAFILRQSGYPAAATIIAGAAVVTLPSVIMVFLFGQSRIFFAMARDGFLPDSLAQVGTRSGVPVRLMMATGVLVAVIAGFFRLDEIAELSNTGTLAAFIAVAVALLVLRVEQPQRPRPFRCPLPWVIAPVAILGCLYLFVSLPAMTLIRFFAWNALGVVVYLTYGMKRSRLGVI